MIIPNLLGITVHALNASIPTGLRKTSNALRICDPVEVDIAIATRCQLASNCRLSSLNGGPCAATIHPDKIPSIGSLSKRDTYDTYVTVDNKGRTFGTVNPCDQWHDSLYNLCEEHACVGDDEYDNASTFNDQGYYEDSYIAIVASGGYPSYDFRNCMIDSLVAAASNGQTWWQTSVQKYTGERFVNGDEEAQYENVNIYQGYGTDWWNIEVCDGNNMVGSLTGYANQANYVETDNTICSSILGAVTSSVSVVNGDFGSVLGVIQEAACSQ